MDNIDLILDSIKKDANKEAEEILSNAKKDGEKIIEDKKQEGQKEACDILARAKKEADLLIENFEITAKREARDIKIKSQNDLVKDILENLKEKLKNMSDEKYKMFVRNSLHNMKLENIANAELLLQENKKHVFDRDYLEINISEDTVEDGFVVRSGKIEYDNRFSSLVDYNKDELERKVVEELFK